MAPSYLALTSPVVWSVYIVVMASEWLCRVKRQPESSSPITLSVWPWLPVAQCLASASRLWWASGVHRALWVSAAVSLLLYVGNLGDCPALGPLGTAGSWGQVCVSKEKSRKLLSQAASPFVSVLPEETSSVLQCRVPSMASHTSSRPLLHPPRWDCPQLQAPHRAVCAGGPDEERKLWEECLPHSQGPGAGWVQGWCVDRSHSESLPSTPAAPGGWHHCLGSPEQGGSPPSARTQAELALGAAAMLRSWCWSNRWGLTDPQRREAVEGPVMVP